MKTAPIPQDEHTRLVALRDADLLDTSDEAFFDEAVKLAAALCDVPTALISLVDVQRQWFKARVGLQAVQTNRDVSFCGHAIVQRGVFVIEDARLDERFFDNPLVVGAPHVVFYAGMPLHVSNVDSAIGTLCIIDSQPRQLSDAARVALGRIGRMVEAHINARRAMRALAPLTTASASRIVEDLVHHAVDFIVCTDGSGRVVYANDAWRHAVGDRGAPSTLLDDVLADTDPGLLDTVSLASRFDGAPGGRISLTLTGVDGQDIHVDGIVTVERVDGVPVLFRCIFRDTTQRHVTEAALVAARLENERYGEIARAMPMGLQVLEPVDDDATDFRIVSVNPALVRHARQTEEQLCGALFLDTYKGAQALKVWQRCRVVLQTGKHEVFEVDEINHNGELVNALSLTVFVLPGRRVAVATTDMVAERQIAQQLAESSSRLHAVFDGVGEAIFATDGAGTIVDCNRAALEMFRLDNIVSAPNLRSLVRVIPERTLHPVPFVAVRSDGTHFFADVMSRPLDLPGSTGSVIVVRDTSASEALERNKREFVANLTHELRTPLTSICGALGLLEGGAIGALAPMAAEVVTIARKNADRLVRLVSDFLDLEKLAENKLTLDPHPVSASLLVSGALEAVGGMAEARGVVLRAQIEHDALVNADENRMGQVLINLLSNAVKFSPAGAEVVVRVASPDPALVRFSIVDGGPGIAVDQQQKLFRRFQKLEGPGQKNVGGSGLGLSIAKAITEHHGGQCGVQSAPGQGSCFWVELPSLATS